ncbi:MAG: hypothetical protein MJ252_00800 [archaeon]|nr:hypothetical protein [archaeon]
MSTQQTQIVPINNTTPINTYAHMKRNILGQTENCLDPIGPNSFYCITCKKSTCPDCDLENHKEHQLIPRTRIYNLDDNFLNEMVDKTTSTEDIQILKKEAVESLENNFKKLREELENIYQAKKNEVDKVFEFATENVNKINQRYKDLQKIMASFYENHQEFFGIETGNNIDDKSTVFLMKLDMLDICEHQNNRTLKGISNLKESLLKYKNEMTTNTNKVIDALKEYLKDELPGFIKENEVKDYYEGIKKRIKTYDEHIESFKKKISEGYNETGNFKNLCEIVKKLDSKNKKGIDCIYNQKVIDYNTNTSALNSSMKGFPTKRSSSKLSEARGVKSKPNTLQPYSTPGTIQKNSKRLSKTNTSKYSERSLGGSKMYRSRSISNIPTIEPEQINLENPWVQRFFAYFIIDIYNKYFAPRSPRKSFDVNSRVYAEYQKRLIALKESAKPIIGRSEVAVFNDLTQSMNRIKITLTKDQHGYINFPEGVRHILINDNLYIIGGVDSFGNPLNIVLLFNIKTNELKRINDTIFPHSYHTVEYLENYDCLIVLGGERNSTCEMLDLNNFNWTSLPDLNYPRANVSAIFNENTSELYALFGMTGNIYKNKNYSDIIEVLKICDASEGWIKVDYYKNSMIDLVSGYSTAFPFSLDKLIIRGSKRSRTNANCYCIYDMNKNEMVVASDKIISQLQQEEVKIKNYSEALNVNNKE